MSPQSDPRMYRECEIKYKIKDEAEKADLKNKIEALGFGFISRNMETDFVPDVEGFLCRKKGILIRFRRVEKEDGECDTLVTMKIKGEAKTFQEYFELEYAYSAVDREVFEKINERLRQATGIMLPESIHQVTSFGELVKKVKEAGFSEHRILLQKKRETYTNAAKKITFDFLPEGIGWYMEIETSDPEELSTLGKAIGLVHTQVEVQDYGEILKAHKKGLPDEEMRTGLFANEPL